MKTGTVSLLTGFILLTFALPVYAVTFDEVIEMTGSGVSAQVIIALIDAGDSVFFLAPDDIIVLQEAGVDNEVILRMIDTMDPDKGVEPEEKVFLKLSDDQFKRIFLEGEEQALQDEQEGYEYFEPNERQPQYYQSSGSYFGQGYVSTQDYSRPSYSSGLTQTSYYYGYPGQYYYDRRYYSPSSYYVYDYPPAYTIYDGKVYYRDRAPYYNPYNRYDPYPKYYQISYPYSYYYKDNYHPRSHVRVRSHPDDNWYFSLGFNF